MPGEAGIERFDPVRGGHRHLFHEGGDTKRTAQHRGNVNMVLDASHGIDDSRRLAAYGGEISMDPRCPFVPQPWLAVFGGKDNLEDHAGKGLRHNAAIESRLWRWSNTCAVIPGLTVRAML